MLSQCKDLAAVQKMIAAANSIVGYDLLEAISRFFQGISVFFWGGAPWDYTHWALTRMVLRWGQWLYFQGVTQRDTLRWNVFLFFAGVLFKHEFSFRVGSP